VSAGIGIMDNLVLTLTGSWFATTIWGAMLSLAILVFILVHGEPNATGGTN